MLIKVAIGTMVFSVGCILQLYAINYAYMQRGVFRVGGEWFVCVNILLLYCLICSLISGITRKEEKKNSEKEDFADCVEYERRRFSYRKR